MTGAGLLQLVALAVPLVMLAACLSPRARARMPSLLAWAPVPALAAALFAAEVAPSELSVSPLHASLALDRPGALLLGVAALLWIAAGVYAATSLQQDRNARNFAAWWFLALAGNIGVFMAADVASFYLFFAMGSLSAYGLIAHDGSPRAWRAGAVYVGLALLGEACVLMGLVFVSAPANSLLIHDAVAALPASPWRDTAMALLIAGFGLKIGLVPLHVWMPLAYTAAPIPAAAVLSGAAVKSGVMGLIRFMPFAAALPDWGGVLVVAGLVSAFYGVTIGITQSNPKTILAYSSVSQMGLIAAVIGMGLATGDASTPSAVGFYAAHHVLVKGALFLAIGVVAATGARNLWPAVLPATVIALGLAGLPFTGGALAKAAVKDLLGTGLVSFLAALSAAGTTLLMLHFLQRLEATAPEEQEDAEDTSPAGLTLPWLALASASIVVPWALFPAYVPGGFEYALSLSGLWASLWPVLVGGLIAFAFWRWPRRLPQLPEGDIVAALPQATRRAIALGATLERADTFLRLWPVAGVSLLTLTILLGAAMAIGN